MKNFLNVLYGFFLRKTKADLSLFVHLLNEQMVKYNRELLILSRVKGMKPLSNEIRAETCPHLMLCHGTNYKWANHTRQGAHTVGDTHEDAGIARSNVQMVDIKALQGKIKHYKGHK